MPSGFASCALKTSGKVHVATDYEYDPEQPDEPLDTAAQDTG